MKQTYEINASTVAIIPLGNRESKVIEMENVFNVEMSPKQIIDYSCKFFGSSYTGRQEGTKTLIGVKYKIPIIVEETKNLIFFPTASPRIQDCAWISLNHIETYKQVGYSTLVEFKNGEQLQLQMSYCSLENQILRATRLDSILRNRKLA